MRQIHRLPFFLSVIILSGIISCTSAFTLSSVSVAPQGYQPAGTPMTVTAVIDFPRAGGAETFPSSRDLLVSTGLSGAQWDPVLVLDEHQTRMPAEKGGMLKITGTYLSYPSTQTLQVRLTLAGTMPEDPPASGVFLRVQEVDAQGGVIATSSIVMPEAPLVISTLPTPPTKVPTVRRTFTPIETASPLQQSPASAVSALIAAAGAALIVMKRK
jgi:hypothetical protein